MEPCKWCLDILAMGELPKGYHHCKCLCGRGFVSVIKGNILCHICREDDNENRNQIQR